ncbi:MAG: peptidase [Deltaproteobacteria bacterium HGW-Deltaproteobacteria-12]|jgi:D-alanyl-D-alanine endopeptidase (penicillin-binding protein 7)|nr:MAG: peptidase [Deltaproteobacteria bacterium HGW-Deltaproteobacteria-12]
MMTMCFLKVCAAVFSIHGESMAKKYLLSILSFVICLLLLPPLPSVAGDPKSSTTKAYSRKSLSLQNGRDQRKLVLRSAFALVEDQETGELLISKQSTTVSPIASITKLMTAMVVLDADIDLRETITIESGDRDIILHSHSRLPVGTRLTRGDALLLALMSSDNRSAHALGRTYPGGFAACVAAMNTKARSLGLMETHFDDTTGLSSGNVSSARDLARLIDAAYKYRLIREYTTCKNAVVRTGRRSVQFCNTNRLIQNPRWQIGLSKTGFTGEAGRCLVMQAQVARRPVLIVLLDSQGRLTRVGDANRIKRWLEEPSASAHTRRG